MTTPGPIMHIINIINMNYMFKIPRDYVVINHYNILNNYYNRGDIGFRSTVPCREAVIISEVNLH